MIARTLILAAIPVLLAACATTDDSWDGFPEPCEGAQSATCRVASIVVDGVTRTFIVTGEQSSNVAANRPLVLVWHGSGTNAEYIRRRFELPTISDTQPIVARHSAAG